MRGWSGASCAKVMAVLALGLCLGCGPTGGGSSADAGGSGSGEETGTPPGCGDGQPERGVFCFERIDVLELSPAYMVAVAADDGDRENLALCAGSVPRTLSFVSLSNGDLDIVESGHACMTDIDRPHLIPGEFRPDLGTEVATATKESLRFHRRVGGEIQVREEPRMCGGIEHICNIPVAAVSFGSDIVAQIVAFDHAPGTPQHTRVAPVLMRRAADEWILAGPPLPDFRTNFGHRHGLSLGDMDRNGTPDLVFASITDGAEAHADYDPTIHRITIAKVRDGELIEHWQGPAGTVPMQIVLGDLDGDERLDLVVQSATAIAVLRGIGDDGFAAPRLLDLDGYDLEGESELGRALDPNFTYPPDRISGIALGDFDGDGRESEIAVIVGPRQTSEGRRRDLLVVGSVLSEDTTITTILRGSASGGLVTGDLTGNAVDDIALVTRRGAMSGLAILLAKP